MTRTSRRNFLQTTLTAGLASSLPASRSSSAAQPTADVSAQSRQTAPSIGDQPTAITFPRRHTAAALARVSCPLGGIGTGGIGLGGRGNLQDWQIFNRADIGNALQYSMPCLYVKLPDQRPYSTVLERRLLPPYDLQQEGLGFANAPGLPRFDEATFFGSFPTSRIEFQDQQCPMQVALDAFSPFQPLDADSSGIPCAVLTYEVHNPTSQPADVVVAWAMTNPVTQSDSKLPDGRRNEIRTPRPELGGIYMTNLSLAPDDPMYGSFAISALSDSKHEYLARWQGGSGWRVGPQHFWFDEFSKTGSLGAETEPSAPVACISQRLSVAPGTTGAFRFLITWHFPNRTPERCGWSAPAGKSKTIIGNWYCTQYKDAWDVAERVQARLPELERKTRAFVNTLQQSTLPEAVIEAASANLSTLVSNTSFRITDGSFQGFEGCSDHRGLGFGTCTHVWNYEVATQFVFPTLARSMRETSFGYATNAEGHMDFRHKLPPSNEYWGAAAADGQMGQIVKLYFDWVLCGDDKWLRQQWAGAKRALASAWRPGGWDERKFGVMDGVQHNTYDVEFYGPNPMCSSWYLAALRATTAMATAMGDTALAEECRHMADEGSRWIDANLFNGEYHIQKIRPIPQDKIASGLQVGMGTKDTMHPQFQVGDGCLVDQLIGQYMATVAGLGDLLDTEHIKKTLASIYKYNYKRSLHNHPSVQRVYALNDEAALVICDYSVGTPPAVPMPYYAEIMTGYEYSAAVLMLANGMVDQGVECIGNIRRRYDGERANPYDETEYGRHYARAMASWASIPILSGFRWDGRGKTLELMPHITADPFLSFWSTPQAWGSFKMQPGRVHVEVNTGALTVASLKVPLATESGAPLKVQSGPTAINATVKPEQNHQVLVFASPVEIKPGRSLQITH